MGMAPRAHALCNVAPQAGSWWSADSGHARVKAREFKFTFNLIWDLLWPSWSAIDSIRVM